MCTLLEQQIARLKKDNAAKQDLIEEAIEALKQKNDEIQRLTKLLNEARKGNDK